VQANRGKIKYSILKVMETDVRMIEDSVVEEISLTLFYNGEQLVTLCCSPSQIEELILGFLLSERLIDKYEDIYSLKYVPEVNCVYVEGRDLASTTYGKLSSACCGKSRPALAFADDLQITRAVRSDIRIPLEDVYFYADYLQNHLPLFQETGGVHSGGIAKNRQILFTSYDIGRHNVLDKLYGQASRHGINLSDHIVFFSGRVASEILFKVAKMGAPILIARSAPTNLAIEYARELNITMAGFARGRQVNIYTCPERLIF